MPTNCIFLVVLHLGRIRSWPVSMQDGGHTRRTLRHHPSLAGTTDCKKSRHWVDWLASGLTRRRLSHHSRLPRTSDIIRIYQLVIKARWRVSGAIHHIKVSNFFGARTMDVVAMRLQRRATSGCADRLQCALIEVLVKIAVQPTDLGGTRDVRIEGVQASNVGIDEHCIVCIVDLVALGERM